MFSLQRYFSKTTSRLSRSIKPRLLNSQGLDFRVENALVVAGSFRSGATWLQEVIASIPETVKVFEPLDTDWNRDAQQVGFHSLQYLSAEAPFPAGEKYLREVLSGRKWTSHTASTNALSECFSPERLVVKFAHANGLLGWMTQQLPVKAPVVIIRHPCAVVASILNLGQETSSLQAELMASELVRGSLELRNYVANLKTPIEQLAAHWCLENAVLFSASNSHNVKHVNYESLISGGVGMMVDIFQSWNMEVPLNLQQRFEQPSSRSPLNRVYKTAEQRLSQWQSELTKPQIHSILNVVEAFGIDFYSDRIHPDYHRLEACRADGLLRSTTEERRAA